ncbi:hypothetical protein [Botrimarina sp.]|uniref:hypothetical protein n=1 Tax=Botrimarina sp. TaxID=2795802 RepID=UPI0032ECF3F4
MPDHSLAAAIRRTFAPLALVGVAVCCASAQDSVPERFVDALDDAGHPDLVAAYLERAADDPLVSDDFKAAIPWRLAAARLGAASQRRDPQRRRDELEQIVGALGPYAQSSEGAASALLDAEERLAVTLADLAHREAIEANREESGSPAERNRRTTARRRLEEARAALQGVESQIVAVRERLKGARPGSPEHRRRRDLGARLGVVRLLAGRMLYEQAETYPANTQERQQVAKQAAEELYELYNKYSKLGVGLYAHLYEGRAYRLLGDAQLATAALEDLTAQPAETPELRKIVSLAQAELAALALDQGAPQRALDKPADWLESLPRGETESMEAATLKYRLGLAALATAESAGETDARRLRRDARDWLGESARVASEVQADARRRWTEVTATLGLASEPPESFDDAFAAAKEAIAAMAAADAALADARQPQREELRTQRRDSRAAAYTALRAAGQLVGAGDDAESVAEARYLLAYLDWDSGEQAAAAERAEDVARSQSATDAGPKAARLAMAALEQLARGGDSAASGRLIELAQFTADRWPGSPAAEAAATVRLSEALRAGDFAAANAALAAAPADRRVGLALRVALARYESAADNDAPARQQLRSALEEAADAGAEATLMASAALRLATALLEQGDAASALSLLTDSAYGPAKLSLEGRPPGNDPPFALAALGAAARARVLTGGGAAEELDAIRELLATAPAESTGGDAAWLRLAAALAGDLDRAPQRWRSGVATALSVALEELNDYQAESDWNTRLWIAQTWLAVSESLPAEAAERAASAACDTLAGLIDKAQSQTGYAPSPTSVLAARLRLAECQRRGGDHAAALETAAAMLAGGRVLLEAQQAAALALQEWGVAERDPTKLEQAIAGARPGDDGKNVIWGWSKLAAIASRYAASDPARRELYFEAWRHVAESRYQSALLADGSLRDEQLDKAAATILALHRQSPDLGGQASRSRFEALLKQIQQAAGDPPIGLPANSG